jgi:hypothetical protein
MGSFLCLFMLIFKHVTCTLFSTLNHVEKKEKTRKVKKKGKAIPVTGRGGPWSCETSRLRYFLDNRLTDSGEFVSLMRRPPLPSRIFQLLISVTGSVDSSAIIRLEGLDQSNNSVTSSGIKTAIFRLIAKFLLNRIA